MAKQATVSPEEDERNMEAELEDGRMPFLAHLRELRDRVRNAAIAFMLAFVVCWYFAKDIFAWLRQPLEVIWMQHTGPALAARNAGPAAYNASLAACNASLAPYHVKLPLGELPLEPDWGPFKLIYTQLTQPFWVDMSIAMWAGIFVASPFIFYQLWQFIAPGLYKRERKVAISFAVFSAVFFVSGALFCFELALPKLYGFFLSYNDAHLESKPTIEGYLDLTRDTMLAFGAVFELPLLIYFLAIVGLVTHRSLWKFSRWFIVVAFIVGAILTPGPDVVSQLMMALPMIALYNVSILVAWRVTAKRERAEAEQRAREDALVERKRTKDDDGESGGDESGGDESGGGSVAKSE